MGEKVEINFILMTRASMLDRIELLVVCPRSRRSLYSHVICSGLSLHAHKKDWNWLWEQRESSMILQAQRRGPATAVKKAWSPTPLVGHLTHTDQKCYSTGQSGQGSLCLSARHITTGRFEVKRKLFHPWRMAEDKVLYQMLLVVYQWEWAQNCTILTTETKPSWLPLQGRAGMLSSTEDLPKTEPGQDSRKSPLIFTNSIQGLQNKWQ